MADDPNSITIEEALMKVSRGPRKRIDITSITKHQIPVSPAGMPEAISSFQSYQTNDHAPIIVDKESLAEGPRPPTTNIQADNERCVEVVITGVPAEVTVDDITTETGASSVKRLQKRVDGVLQQTSAVVLTYDKDRQHSPTSTNYVFVRDHTCGLPSAATDVKDGIIDKEDVETGSGARGAATNTPPLNAS